MPKDVVSRWIMRAREGGQVLRIPLLAVTAISTLTTALKVMGFGQWILPSIVGFGAGAVAFLYLYDQSGVMQRQYRERMDRADNYCSAGIAINRIIEARQLAAAVQAINEDMTREEAVELMEAETIACLREYRDGADLEGIYHNGADPRDVTPSTEAKP